MPEGSFRILKSPAKTPLEDPALQPLVRRMYSGKIHEQDPWMSMLSETQEAKKLSAWKSLCLCAKEQEYK